MRRATRLLLIAAASLLLIAPAAEALIQVDRGIAGARIGNSKSEVRTALGKPRRVIKARTIFGPYTEYRFRGGIRVRFQGNRDVTLVITTGVGDRTPRASASGRRNRRSRTTWRTSDA